MPFNHGWTLIEQGEGMRKGARIYRFIHVIRQFRGPSSFVPFCNIGFGIRVPPRFPDAQKSAKN